MTVRAVPQPQSPVAPSDETLLQRLRDGESAAGEELVHRYSRSIIRYLQRLTQDDHLAEELHQQTWLSVLDHLDRFSARPDGGGFKAWLFRIATNKANDHFRSYGRQQAARREMRLLAAEPGPQAGHRAEAAEQEQKLMGAIAQLPENQRQVLLLRYYSNMKFAEIAKTLGCPLNTALGRMHRAMLKLKELMEQEK